MNTIERLEKLAGSSRIDPTRLRVEPLIDAQFARRGARLVQESEDTLSIQVVAQTIPTEARWADQGQRDFELLAEALRALPALLKLARAAAKASALLVKLDPGFEYLAHALLNETLEPVFADVALDNPESAEDTTDA